MWYFVILIVVAIIASRVLLFTSGEIVVPQYGKISPDAVIVNIAHEHEHWRRDTYIKTIVYFSDGTEYHTRKTFGVPGYGHTKLIIDDVVLEEIVADAQKAHAKRVASLDPKFK